MMRKRLAEDTIVALGVMEKLRQRGYSEQAIKEIMRWYL